MQQVSETQGFSSETRRRLAAVLAMMSAEYVALTLNFDGLLHLREGWWSNLSALVPALTLVITASVVLVRASGFGAGELRGLFSGRMPRWMPFLPVHLGCFVGLWLCALLLQSHPQADWFSLGVIAFGTLAVLSGWTAYRLIATEELLHRVRGRLARPLATSVLLATTMFVLGSAAEQLWVPVAGATLNTVAAVMRSLFDDVYVWPDERVLSLGDFTVKVAPECSGFEGMGLVAVVTGVYIWLRRRVLPVPWAFALVPLVVVIAWLANIGRIVLLMYIGARYSRDVALGGFHSQAGWILFSVVSLLMVAGVQRLERPAIEGSRSRNATQVDEVQSLASPLLLPLLVTLSVGMVTSLFTHAALDRGYALRVLAGGAMLWLYRRPLRSLVGKLDWICVAGGVGAYLVWLLLAEPRGGVEKLLTLYSFPEVERALWILGRVLGSCLVVPIAEELAFRGFLYRRLIRPDFEAVPLHSFSWTALVVSSLAFGALHQDFIAGSLAGAIYALVQIKAGNVNNAVLAHVLTNTLLTLHVLVLGQWGYW